MVDSSLTLATDNADPAEKAVISSAVSEIHVFWIDSARVDGTKWPHNRKYVARNQKYTSGVFVMYQSSSPPLDSLGMHGDLWLTRSMIYFKQNDESWTQWSCKLTALCCPYDTTRKLIWTRNAELKYVGHHRPEVKGWKLAAERVPFKLPKPHGPEDERIQQAIIAACKKKYQELEDHDIRFILNAHCDSIRSPLSGTFDASMASGTNENERGNGNVETRGLSGSASADAEPMDVEPDVGYCIPSEQATYEPFPITAYQTPPDGRACSGSVKCWNRMYIPLPWSEIGPDKDPDIILCQRIAEKSMDATASTKNDDTAPNGSGAFTKPPIVKVVDSPKDGCSVDVWQEHVALVKQCLSIGITVIIRDTGPKGPAYSFDAKSVQTLSHRNPDGAPIQWNSSLTQNQTTDQSQDFQTTKGTVREFFAAASNKQDRVNCLDLPIPPSHVPLIITHLASNVHSLSITDSLGFDVSVAEASPSVNESASSTLPNRPEKKRKRTHDTNDDHVEEHSRPGKQKKTKKPRTQTAADTEPIYHSTSEDTTVEEKLKRFLELCDGIGIKHIEWDAIRISAWVLLTSSCCFTNIHQDAAGYFTYVKCETGVKFWCYVVPKDSPTEITEAVKLLLTVLEDSKDTETIADHADLVSLVLTPGTIVIQPAGSLHMVHTLTDSIFTGGHFYMLDGMHLVEMTRACAAFTGQSVTNASHPGCLRSLCRIALSLLFNKEPEVLRKPFISLARMILWSELYAPGDVYPEGFNFPTNAESIIELEAARTAVEAILQHNNIDPKEIKPKELKEFEWLLREETGKDWKDPGTATIAIPVM